MSDPEIVFERRGAVGLVTLNRPKALNALTHAMCVSFRLQLDVWAITDDIKTIVVRGAGDRAFCAGGDIRSLYESGKAGTPYAREFYRDEYILDAVVKHYPKPYVALISGIVMGGGVGVSVHGSHRIADETTTFAMPETGIGLFPDVGGSYFLPRISGEIGMYLALTGARLKTADAVACGIATHFVPAAKREDLLDRLARGLDPEMAVSGVAQEPGAPPLLERRPAIDRLFAKMSVEEILDALDRETGDWARDTAKTIRTKSPTSLKLTYRQLREGAKHAFDDCMRMEYRMVNRVIAGHDFYEGVRATIIDKDNVAKWRPSSLGAIKDEEIVAYFAPLAEELPLG